MKQVLFLLLLAPLFSEAQRREWDIAYYKSIPQELGKPIHMPDRDYNPNFDWEETYNYRQKSRVYIISSDSIYRKLFWRYVYTQDSLKKYDLPGDYFQWQYKWMKEHLIDSLPIIDFSKNDLIVYAACAQCFAYCEHEQGSDSCHRNACNFRETFYIREKKK